jgi:hypothetical protein
MFDIGFPFSDKQPKGDSRSAYSAYVRRQTYVESSFIYFDICGDQVALLLDTCFEGEKSKGLTALGHLKDKATLSKFFNALGIFEYSAVYEAANRLDEKYRNQIVVHSYANRYRMVTAQGLLDPYLHVSINGPYLDEKDRDFMTNPSPGVVTTFSNMCALVDAVRSLIEANSNAIKCLNKSIAERESF